MIAAPFSAALEISSAGPGRYLAELGEDWTVGGKAHGGLLLALLTRAGLAGLDQAARDPDDPPAEPVAVSAEYLRAPDPGPVELHTELVKAGRTVSVVTVTMLQRGRAALTATVSAGRLPAEPADWVDLPELGAEPSSDAFPTSDGPLGEVLRVSKVCDVRLDSASASFLRRERTAPRIRGWVRPLGEPVSVLFALLAGDILPPTLFNLGRRGWSPTVQLTALVRARPAPGWLRLDSVSRVVAGGWFDEDVTVIDSAGRLVVQARQLALSPAIR